MVELDETKVEEEVAESWKLKRREFLKALLAGIGAGFFATAFGSSIAAYKYFLPPPKYGKTSFPNTFGQVDRIRITCISETSWFNNIVLVNDIMKAGGLLVNQYTIPWSTKDVKDGWSPENYNVGDNSGGYSALIETWAKNGKEYHRFLLDWGWNQKWMEYIYNTVDTPTKDVPSDRLIKGKIIDLIKAPPGKGLDFVFISHEHFDHYWGMDTVLKYNPNIPVYVPGTMYPESFELLKGVPRGKYAPHAWNEHPHTGPLHVAKEPLVPFKIFDGCVGVLFDIPIICRVRGEEVLYFWVKDHGLVTVTGCNHPGIITLYEYGIRNFKDVRYGHNMYGVYGGLHISPFEDWDPDHDDLVLALPKYGLKKVGCNHCTGYITVEKFLKVGIPVVRGTARHKTKKDLYLGNADVIEFP